MKQTYNPGTKGYIKSEGKGCYTVQSFRNNEEDYRVNLNAGTCSCPDHQFRQRECKHIKAAKQEAYNNTVQIAQTQTLENLQTALFVNAGTYREEVKEAISFVIYHKEKEAKQESNISETAFGKNHYQIQ